MLPEPAQLGETLLLLCLQCLSSAQQVQAQPRHRKPMSGFFFSPQRRPGECHQPWCSARWLLLRFGLDHPKHTTRSWTHFPFGSRTLRNILKLAQSHQNPSSHQEPIQFSPEHEYSLSIHNSLWQGLLLLSYMMCEEHMVSLSNLLVDSAAWWVPGSCIGQVINEKLVRGEAVFQAVFPAFKGGLQRLKWIH